ncbi:MAG: cupin domain-containing protein [Deltaproteobacteria bacterium]|jgi:mannose-6-phosphate isomerase-like protein (cupin superfamily)|nr:cupin domain-containing protein [Deltaproteobacteria bacterium]
MLKFFLFGLGLVLPAVLTSSLSAQNQNQKQVYSQKEFRTLDREKLAGGEGMIAGKFSFLRNDPETPEKGICEIGWLTIQPGDSIGLHEHKTEEDVYVIVSGQGIFTDGQGAETEVAGGDITVTRRGQSHSLKNTGQTPMIVLDVLAR